MTDAAPDQDHRDRARLGLEANAVVEAGAGTGKTTLLTDRLLFLMLAGPKGEPVPIHRVVALTFTEKAAAEIKLRLSDRLSELAARLEGERLAPAAAERADRTLGELAGRFGAEAAAVRPRARAALEDLDKSQIGTIHSFAAHLLRLYPVAAGVDPGFRVDEGEAFAELFASEWARWLDSELGEKAPRRKDWLEVLALASLDDLEALARELCAEKLELDSAGRPCEQTAAWLEALAGRAAALPKGQPAARANSKILPAIAALERHLRELAAAARAEEPPLPAALSFFEASSQWPKAWDPDGGPLYEKAREAAKVSSAGAEALLRRAARLLLPFARGFRALYTRRGLISFDGLLVKARDLVRDQPEAREELKRRFSAFLIDEFQDTDPLQGELLLFLAEAPGRAARSWRDAAPGPGRLFVVGDPKQSIYRFRGADMAAYQGFTRRVLGGAGGRACDLTANFRSPASVLEPVNAVFDRLMTEVPGLQAAHKALEPGKPAEGGGIRLVAITEPETAGAAKGAAAIQQVEAAWIADWIAEHCAKDGLRYRDAAVLLRTSGPLGAVLDAFKERGIPYAVELERHFYGLQEISDFLNLLRALDDPGDRLALSGVLRGPLGGIDDADLMVLAREGGPSYARPAPAGLRALAKAPVERLFTVLRDLRERVGRRPLGELVRAVLDETALLELCAAAYHGQQSASNLLKFARLADEASERRGETLREFIESVARQAEEGEGEGESPLADEHLDAVRVMTIHKAKGLEFPVVFLANAGSGRRGGKKPASLRDWSARRAGLRLRGCGAADAAMAVLEAAEREREEHELLRLLYVAMTRAKDRLFILGKEKGDKAAFTTKLAAAGFWPQGGVSPLKVPADRPLRAQAPKRAPGAPAPAARLAKLWAARRKRRDAALALAWTTTPSGAVLKESPAGASAGGPHGRVAGILCHSVLRGWDFAGGADLATALERAARAALFSGEKVPPEAVAEARTVLAGFLGSASAKELSEVEIVGRELAFARADGGAVARGSIDLLYRVKKKLVVADYKSDPVTAKTAAALRKRYAPQGKAYCEAVKAAMGETPEFRMIFLRAPDL